MATLNLQAVEAKIARRINNFAGTYCNRKSQYLVDTEQTLDLMEE
jgi:hypothetical protein